MSDPEHALLTNQVLTPMSMLQVTSCKNRGQGASKLRKPASAVLSSGDFQTEFRKLEGELRPPCTRTSCNIVLRHFDKVPKHRNGIRNDKKNGDKN